MTLAKMFPLTTKNLGETFYPPVAVDSKNLVHFTSINGRSVCFAQNFIAPFKGLSKICEVGTTALDTCSLLVRCLTFNEKPAEFSVLLTRTVDTSLSAVTIPLAITSHGIRGVAGMILHPGILLRTKCTSDKPVESRNLKEIISTDFFPLTMSNFQEIMTKPEVYNSEISPLIQREVSVVRVIGTPISLLRKSGQIVSSGIDVMSSVAKTLTFNESPKSIVKILANGCDTIVAPFPAVVAVVVNAGRAVGGIIQPSILFEESMASETELQKASPALETVNLINSYIPALEKMMTSVGKTLRFPQSNIFS